jgi:hypothetical protein
MVSGFYFLLRPGLACLSPCAASLAWLQLSGYQAVGFRRRGPLLLPRPKCRWPLRLVCFCPVHTDPPDHFLPSVGTL